MWPMLWIGVCLTAILVLLGAGGQDVVKAPKALNYTAGAAGLSAPEVQNGIT